MSFENFIWAKKFVALFIKLKTEENNVKDANKGKGNWWTNHAGIQLQVSNLKIFKLDICIWTPTQKCNDYVTNECIENQ